MVEAAVFAGALDAHHVLRLLDHADHAAVAARVRAHRARARLAHVATNLTEPNLGLDLFDGLGQLAGLIFGGGQHVESNALSSFGTDSGQAPECVNQPLNGAVIGQCHVCSSCCFSFRMMCCGQSSVCFLAGWMFFGFFGSSAANSSTFLTSNSFLRSSIFIAVASPSDWSLIEYSSSSAATCG